MTRPAWIVAVGLAVLAAATTQAVSPAAASTSELAPAASAEIVTPATPIELCDIFIVACAVIGEASEAATDVVATVGSTLLAPLADAVASAVTELLKSGLSWWMSQSTIRVSDAGAWGSLSGPMLWLSGLVAMLLLIVQAIRTMLSRRGAALLQAVEGLLVWAVLAAVSVALVDLLARMSDALTEAIRAAAFDGGTEGMASRIADMTLLAPGSPALVLLMGLLAFLVGVVHMFVLFFRQVAIPIQTLLLPIAAAGQVGQGASREWLGRLWASILAVLAYKPVAMLIIGVGFSEAGTGSDLVDAIRGVATLLLSIVALPVLMALFSPILTTGRGSGGGVLGAANTAVWGMYLLGGRRGSAAEGSEAGPAAAPAPTIPAAGAAPAAPAPAVQVANTGTTAAAPASGSAVPAVTVAVVAAEAAAKAAREAATHAGGEPR
ncbi:MAG: hypothetical protein L0Y54_05140 [Sporichthyaceae bacterium]|nr:hypothetical protein [Sporichthyaceae bacterium]